MPSWVRLRSKVENCAVFDGWLVDDVVRSVCGSPEKETAFPTGLTVGNVFENGLVPG